jgi:GNAT superfamily N-acetyltransferase
MVFRSARLTDLPRIRALRRAAASILVARFGKGPWSHTSMLGAARRALNGSLFVLEEDGGIAAVCTLDREDATFYAKLGYARPADPAFYLRSMSVDPLLQGRGTGRRMLRAAEDLARARGLAALRLDAYTHAAGAGGFYEKCGYVSVSTGVMDGVRLRFYEKRL